MNYLKPRNCFLLILAALLFYSCGENPVEGTDDENIPTNRWISANMDFYYYWNDLMPQDRTYSVTPEVFYELLLFQGDSYSEIYPDYEELLEELNGTELSAGFSPYFGQFLNSSQVFLVVEFVYPGSPADTAGLKRGDIILAVNGQTLTTSSYRFLYNASNMQNVTLGEYLEDSNQIVSSDSVVQVQTTELDKNPVLYQDVLEANNEKVGYLVYTEFTKGEEDKYIQALNDTLSGFKSQGITELIVDLRYNRGGQLDPAEVLANTIVPSQYAANEDVFVSFQYNDTLQSYYVEQQGPDSENLNARFSENPNNLGLERVFFLTSQNTASASELLINGLIPYMDVVIIGEATFGKYYGSTILYDSDGSSNHTYAISPVHTKYANADGQSDFPQGLPPDYEIQDNIIQPKPLGDTSDPMISKALEVISGVSAKPVERIPFQYKKLEDSRRMKRGNILLVD